MIKELTGEISLFRIGWMSGHTIDRRTVEGKDDVKRIKEMDSENMKKAGDLMGLSPELVCLRMKDLIIFDDLYTEHIKQ